MKTNMTFHARVERDNRLEFIIDTVGIGEVICETNRPDDSYGKPVKMRLTDTGVIIVTSQENKIITAYIATISEAIGVYREATTRHELPSGLYKKIRQNEKLYTKNGKTIKA